MNVVTDAEWEERSVERGDLLSEIELDQELVDQLRGRTDSGGPEVSQAIAQVQARIRMRRAQMDAIGQFLDEMSL